LKTLLLDASVWISAADPSDKFHSDSMELFTRSASGQFNPAVLDLTLYETANVAVTKWRDQARAVELAREIELATVGRVVRADSDLIVTAATIASEHSISTYDASYVAASRACQWPLVSIDLRDLVSKELAVLPGDAFG